MHAYPSFSTWRFQWKLSRILTITYRITGLLSLLFVALTQVATLHLLIFFVDLINDLTGMFQSSAFKNRQPWAIFSFTAWSIIFALCLATELGRFVAFATAFVVFSDLALPVCFLILSFTSRAREYINNTHALQKAREEYQKPDPSKTEAYRDQLNRHIQYLETEHRRIVVKTIVRSSLLLMLTIFVVMSPFVPTLTPFLPSILLGYGIGMLVYKSAMYLYKDTQQTPTKNAAKYAHPNTQTAQVLPQSLIYTQKSRQTKNLPALSSQVRTEYPVTPNSGGFKNRH